MSTETKRLPNEPIIVHKVIPPPVTPDDVLAITRKTAEFKHEINQHVYRIVDFSLFGDNFTFSDLIHGMAAELKVEGGINDQDISSLFVGAAEWVVFGVEAFQKQEQYGKTNVIFLGQTVDEAIEFARAAIKKTAS